MDKVQLKIGGKVWNGWKSVNTTRSLSAVTGEHQFGITYRWQNAEVLPLQEGVPVEVLIGDDKVASGYITSRTPSYDGRNVSYEITARCKTTDLVETSLLHSTGEWKNIALDALAVEVCRPYGINVVVQTNMGEPFSTVRVEQGESPFELLERLARQRGVLLTSDENGDLVLTRTNKAVLAVTLELGVNIRAARGNFSESERFDRYIVKGVGNGADFDSDSPSQVGGKQVTVEDGSVSRYRPKIILTEEVFTVEGASRRGQWQKQRALAMAVQSEITVGGWRMPSGELWPVNRCVKVIDPIQGINGLMLIASVSRVEDDQGRSTILGLVPPEAMDIPPEAEESTKEELKWEPK